MKPEEENTYIENYLLGNLSNEEVLAFEKRMSDDVRFRESVQLQKQLFESLSDDNWSHVENADKKRLKEYEELYKSDATLQLKETLERINKEQNGRASKKIKPLFFYISAATVIILIAFGILLPEGQGAEELFVNYFETSDIPSIATRGAGKDSILIRAEKYFEEGNYDEVLTVFTKSILIDTITQNRGSALLYKGISEMQSKKFDKANTTFTKLSNSDLINAPMGLWYKALLHLKMNNPEKAKELLMQISTSPSNYKYKEAKELLEEL